MPRQTDLRFTFELATGDATHPHFDVVEFRLEEALSEPFLLTLDLASAHPAIDFGQVLDQPALFALWRGEQVVRYVHGVVSSFEQADTGFRRTRYKALVEPTLARAGLRSDWRIFQQQTVPQILQTVLKRSGITDAEQTLTKDHLQREYCVQPGETDLDFFSRLSAEEGLYFAFTHSAQGHRLIQGDRLYVHGAIDGAVTYNPAPGGDQAEPCLRSFRYSEQVRTARQVSRDYTFKHPQYNQQQSSDGAALDHQARDYERYDYPGRYKRDEAGKPFTEARLLALRRDAQIATVEGDDARLQPGFAFDLEGHPREDWNHGWRPVRMRHYGTQTTSQQEESFEATVGTHYSYTAELIPDRTEWKPPQSPKPRIDGPQMATVVGPQGEEIFTDNHGRVKVQFPWDREGQNDEHSSCWIRVSQNWAGAAWGHIAIPRIGHEVIVSYVDGDCDQPIITGRTYPATNPPPYELPKFDALSTVKSKELKGARANELRIDDTPAQISAALMSDHGNTALHLGYLTHPRPKGGEPRGEGFELRTDEHGALRAAKGLFLSTDGQAKAQGGQLSRAELIQCLESALDLAKQLGDYAEQHQGLSHDAAPQQDLTHAVRDLGHGANDESNGTSGGQPLIALSSPAGIAAGTPQSITLAAGRHLDSIAQQNQQLTAGQTLVMNAGQGLGLFAHGGELRQIAHQGNLSLQAQQTTVRVEGKQSVELYATEEHILAIAGKHVTLMSGGSYIKLQGGDIEIGCPGTLRFKASTYDMQGGASQNAELPQFDVGDTQRKFVVTMPDGIRPVPNQPYTLTLTNGDVIKGITDAQGATQLLKKDAMHIANLQLTENGNAQTQRGGDTAAAEPQTSGAYSQTFVLQDEKTGDPLAGTFYKITTASGQEISGQADRDGYPTGSDEKDMAYQQRKADALELALKDFREAWPIPTITVARSYDSTMEQPRTSPQGVQKMLSTMVNRLRQPAGLHWHEINQLNNGEICNDTPEDVVEDIFKTFEANPDMPAILVYALDAVNMAGVLGPRGRENLPIGAGGGPRQPGQLTDSMVALVVARPERVNWLRGFVKYTKGPGGRSIYPGFTFWDREPPQAFRPSPFIPQPWTKLGFAQWDAMQTLAVLHRPVVVSLDNPAKPGSRLKNEAMNAALANGWKQATDGITPPPSRVFYDGGQKPVAPPLAELMPALKVAGSPIDLLESKESYDLTQRLGDTGAASPFVGIALATMASYTHADTSVVIPLRRADQATLITITSATPGKKPAGNPFGVNLLLQTASSEEPSKRIREEMYAAHHEKQHATYVRPVEWEKAMREQKLLDDFIASGPGVDLDKP